MSCKMYSVKLGTPSHIKGTKLYKVEMYGCSTVVTVDLKEGDLGLLCTPDCIISPETLEVLGITLPYIYGGRVKPLKLVKGTVYSDSLFIPVNDEQYKKLTEFTDNKTADDLLKALTFTKLNNDSAEVEEGGAWTTYKPSNVVSARRQDTKGSKSSRVRRFFATFPMHVSTAQYPFNVARVKEMLEQGWDIEVTRKYHGTSGRTAYGLQPFKLNWWQNILDKIGFKQKKERLQYAYGSRRIILEQRLPTENYKEDNYRSRASLLIEESGCMKAGDVVYYELVGYTDRGKPIQPAINGKDYSYGLPPYHCGIVIYRWTSGGKDLSLVDIASRLSEYQFYQVRVPTLSAAKDHAAIEVLFNEIEADNVKGKNSCVEEGLVIHLLKDGNSEYYKWKTPSFYLGESTSYDNAPPMDEEDIN